MRAGGGSSAARSSCGWINEVLEGHLVGWRGGLSLFFKDAILENNRFFFVGFIVRFA